MNRKKNSSFSPILQRAFTQPSTLFDKESSKTDSEGRFTHVDKKR